MSRVTKSGKADKRFKDADIHQEAINEDFQMVVMAVVRNIINTPVLFYLLLYFWWFFERMVPNFADAVRKFGLIEVAVDTARDWISGIALILVVHTIFSVRKWITGMGKFEGERMKFDSDDGFFFRIYCFLLNAWGLPIIAVSLSLYFFGYWPARWM